MDDTIFKQPFAVDWGWTLKQKVSTIASFWEGDHIANGLRVAENGHYSIET
jgi:hypothetical protein